MSDSKYKRDLDKLFESGGKVPERFKGMMDKLKPEEGSDEAIWHDAVKELRNAEDFRAFATAATGFKRAGHRWPDDEELLIKLLDHPNEGIVQATLAHYVDLASRRTLSRPGPLKSRIKTIRSIAEETRTNELLDKVEKLV